MCMHPQVRTRADVHTDGHAKRHVHAPVCPTAGARLQRLIPGAQRVILPDSGHAALLEWDVNLGAMIANAFPDPEAKRMRESHAACCALRDTWLMRTCKHDVWLEHPRAALVRGVGCSCSMMLDFLAGV